MIEIILPVVGITLIYLTMVKPFSYWRKKNVPTGKVTPLFGDTLPNVLGKEAFPEMMMRIYNKLMDVRYIGCYIFMKPYLMIRSPELIKQLCVKDFDHFMNHRPLIADGVDELWSKNLLGLKGKLWKDVRSSASPSFTCSKLKAMFTFIRQNANQFVENFLKKNEDNMEVDLKDAYTRYTCNVIANAVFGLEVDSLGDRENEFYIMGTRAANLTRFWAKFVFFIYMVIPRVAAFLGLTIFGSEEKSFFINLVNNTIKMRQDKNIERPDVLGILLETRKRLLHDQHNNQTSNEIKYSKVEEHSVEKNAKRILTDMEIIAQVFIFFLGGYETASSAMCFVAYELALNPDIQQKLFEEIQGHMRSNREQSYEAIINMTYMDMVVSETLRKWPIAAGTDRQVTAPYTIKPELADEKPINLDVNDIILVPIMGIHRDPKYYMNPEKFDPERFSPENKKNINPYTYMPFGVGPRNFIASRFALLEIKTVFFFLLSQFEIVPIEKTQIPLKFKNNCFINLAAEKGFHLGVKRRS